MRLVGTSPHTARFGLATPAEAFGWTLKQAQAIMLIAAAVAGATKVSGDGTPAAAEKAPAIVGPSATAAAAALGPVLTRSLSLQSSTAGGQPEPQLMPTASDALCKLQDGRNSPPSSLVQVVPFLHH